MTEIADGLLNEIDAEIALLKGRLEEEYNINRVLSASLEAAEKALRDIGGIVGEGPGLTLAQMITNRYFGKKEG